MSEMRLDFAFFYDEDFFTQSSFDFDYGHQSKDKQNFISQLDIPNIIKILGAQLH